MSKQQEDKGDQGSSTISIIGTGDFARALGSRLLYYNYHVVFGSRFPRQRHLETINPIFTNVLVKRIPECITSSDIVFLCIHHEHHHTLKQYEQQFKGRIIIDVSNSNKAPKVKDTSFAQILAQMFPESYVIKGFNTLSAYGIADEAAGESKIVYVCGNNATARDLGLHVARSIGFIGVDRGTISGAKELEAMPHDLCGGWSASLWITLVVSIGWFIYTLLRYFVLREDPYTWERFPMNILNKFFGEVGIMLLAFCFLPGCIAAFIQIFRGTKYRPFPSCLDTWLKSRKYLGLLALLNSSLHTFMSTVLLNAEYFGDFYKTSDVSIDVNSTQDVEFAIDSRMSWMGELSVSCGFLGMALMVILGITSIPAIGNLMNWRQWNFIHSQMGLLCLFLCTAHITIKGAYSWVHEPFSDYYQSMAFLGSFTPWVVMFFKVILYLPCVSSYVDKIRAGWERNPQEADPETGSSAGFNNCDHFVSPIDNTVGNGSATNEAFHSTGL